MIDPRPLSPAELIDDDDLIERVVLWDLMTEEEAREADPWHLERLLKEHYEGW
jgi:hypothetical protein